MKVGVLLAHLARRDGFACGIVGGPLVPPATIQGMKFLRLANKDVINILQIARIIDRAQTLEVTMSDGHYVTISDPNDLALMRQIIEAHPA